MSTAATALSRFLTFDRAAWAHLRDSTPLTLSESDIAALRGLNDALSMDEVVQIYLPLSRLLNLYVHASQGLYRTTQTFLGNDGEQVPFIIGLAGSVAVGKSTTARILQALLSRWPNHPSVDLVTTDGFLFPNAVLESRGLMKRKGFPGELRPGPARALPRRRQGRHPGSARACVLAPALRHRAGAGADRAPTRHRHRRGAERAAGAAAPARHRPVVRVGLLRLLDLRGCRRATTSSSGTSRASCDWSRRCSRIRTRTSTGTRRSTCTEARATAAKIWAEINAPNLRENIQPTRMRAHLILTKGARHLVEHVQLRRV